MVLQDFFNETPKEESLEEKFTRERLEWSNKISEMSATLKNILEIPTLQTTIYTERQRCVEYHHYLMTLISTISKEHRKQYSERYDYWTYKSQTRFPNEDTKKTRILSEIADINSKKDALDNHSKFMTNTLASIDHVIWGIQRRIDLEKIIRA